MNNPLEILTTYGLDAEWLLTWYPVRPSANLRETKIRGGTFNHKNTDQPFLSGNELDYFIGSGSMHVQDGDPMAPNNLVHAFIKVRVNNNKYFEVELQVVNGPFKRTKDLVLQPDSTVPFMVNIQARGEDPVVRDTTLTLQGVFVTGRRPNLFDLFVGILGK